MDNEDIVTHRAPSGLIAAVVVLLVLVIGVGLFIAIMYSKISTKKSQSGSGSSCANSSTNDTSCSTPCPTCASCASCDSCCPPCLSCDTCCVSNGSYCLIAPPLTAYGLVTDSFNQGTDGTLMIQAFTNAPGQISTLTLTEAANGTYSISSGTLYFLCTNNINIGPGGSYVYDAFSTTTITTIPFYFFVSVPSLQWSTLWFPVTIDGSIGPAPFKIIWTSSVPGKNISMFTAEIMTNSSGVSLQTFSFTGGQVYTATF